MNIDWMTIVGSWGPIAAPLLVFAFRMWMLMEKEIVSGRESRARREEREAANDAEALKHMTQIRDDVSALRVSVAQIADHITRGGRQ